MVTWPLNDAANSGVRLSLDAWPTAAPAPSNASIASAWSFYDARYSTVAPLWLAWSTAAAAAGPHDRRRNASDQVLPQDSTQLLDRASGPPLAHRHRPRTSSAPPSSGVLRSCRHRSRRPRSAAGDDASRMQRHCRQVIGAIAGRIRHRRRAPPRRVRARPRATGAFARRETLARHSRAVVVRSATLRRDRPDVS